MRAREVVGRIKKLGGRKVRQVGSHARYEADYTRSDGSKGTAATAVAMHPGDVPPGTLHKIESDMKPAFGEGWLR